MEETWDQIGAKLRQAREKAGMVVDDVVFRARIPKSVVEALEAEDFSVFSSPTYAKSFLRQYSEFLGVDAEPWLDALEPAAYIGGDVPLQPGFTDGPSSGSPKRAAREHGRQDERSAPDGSGKWSAVWLMVMTALIVVAIVKGYEIFDHKFGSEPAPVKKVMKPASAEPSVSPEQGETGQAAPAETAAVSEEAADAEKKEETVRPPRAIIVRD